MLCRGLQTQPHCSQRSVPRAVGTPGVRAAPAWPWAGYLGDTADPSAGAHSRTAEPSTADPRHAAGAQERPGRTGTPLEHLRTVHRVLLPVHDISRDQGPGWLPRALSLSRAEREALEKPARQSQGKAGRD